MAKQGGKAAAAGKSTTLTDTKGDASVVGVEADGHSSLKLYLSNGQEVFCMACGGGNWAANEANRDIIVDAITRTIQANAIPKAG